MVLAAANMKSVLGNARRRDLLRQIRAETHGPGLKWYSRRYVETAIAEAKRLRGRWGVTDGTTADETGKTLP
jgi:hypothetical protein